VKRFVADAGFLIALHDDQDPYHERARHYFVEFFGDKPWSWLLVPWPVLYESLSTRLMRSGQRRLDRFYREWKDLEHRGILHRLPDEPYRDQVLENLLGEIGRAAGPARTLSLTDRVLRAILRDDRQRVDFLLTFNPSDFADLCQPRTRRVQLLT
jgi:predicted nucleic acid-binding protein